ncbi:MAG: DUF3073 domain-containing protein [Actinomycetota bacterium]
MGRGRAKAKQTKVARQLKYQTTGTDLEALRAELVGSGNGEPERHDPSGETPAGDELEPDGDDLDPYDDYAADDGDDLDPGGGASHRR